MKEQFTHKQVLVADVDYSLEEFWMDLGSLICEQFCMFSEAKQRALQHMVYQILYFSFLGLSEEEIQKKLRLPSKFAEMLLDAYQEQKEMLGAVIMSQFIKNLRKTGGLLSDTHNLELMNANLRTFHKAHNL